MNISWEKVLLVWNRWHKNLWDELILIWNIKLLLKQWKEIYVACSNKQWLKNFHKQFFKDCDFCNLEENENGYFDKNKQKQVITYLQELPKGFRSFFKFLKNIKDFFVMFKVDSILIGWWEIFTEETPFSYFYWFASVWPLFFWKKLYLSWWIQIPKKIWNKLIFKLFLWKAEKIYTRDYDLVWKIDKVEFFPDTSLYVMLWSKKYIVDEKNYKWLNNTEKQDWIVVNINKKAEKFFPEIENIVENFYRQWKNVYFARVCKSPLDDDIVYYHKLKQKFVWIKLLDWEDFFVFLKILECAEKVYTTRLHLFLISFYLNLEVEPFVYQKKVEKMKKVFENGKN